MSGVFGIFIFFIVIALTAVVFFGWVAFSIVKFVLGGVGSLFAPGKPGTRLLWPSQAFWMSIVSFGLWPLWRMGRQFRAYVVFERQQLWHLAEWLRLRRGGDDALGLQDQLQMIQPSLVAKRLNMFCVICICMVF